MTTMLDFALRTVDANVRTAPRQNWIIWNRSTDDPERKTVAAKALLELDSDTSGVNYAPVFPHGGYIDADDPDARWMAEPVIIMRNATGDDYMQWQSEPRFHAGSLVLDGAFGEREQYEVAMERAAEVGAAFGAMAQFYDAEWAAQKLLPAKSHYENEAEAAVESLVARIDAMVAAAEAGINLIDEAGVVTAKSCPGDSDLYIVEVARHPARTAQPRLRQS